jgi:hypothetical protein
MADSNQNQNRQYMPPVDPFTPFMWGPPGPRPMMPPGQSDPYPTGAPPGPFPGTMNANDNFDINKMLDGADKFIKFMNQTQPMLKSLAPLFNMFKK